MIRMNVRCMRLVAVFLLAASACFAVGDEGTANHTLSAKSVTTFTISDGAECCTINSGAWKLAGTLKIESAGRIEPHDNTEAVLFERHEWQWGQNYL